jgi:hypothetical protein
VTNQDAPRATNIEDGTHLTIVNGAGGNTWASKNIYSFIIEHYARQSLDTMLSEVTHYPASCYW